jgi:hypothetical protein
MGKAASDALAGAELTENSGSGCDMRTGGAVLAGATATLAIADWTAGADRRGGTLTRFAVASAGEGWAMGAAGSASAVAGRNAVADCEGGVLTELAMASAGVMGTFAVGWIAGAECEAGTPADDATAWACPAGSVLTVAGWDAGVDCEDGMLTELAMASAGVVGTFAVAGWIAGAECEVGAPTEVAAAWACPAGSVLGVAE